MFSAPLTLKNNFPVRWNDISSWDELLMSPSKQAITKNKPGNQKCAQYDTHLSWRHFIRAETRSLPRNAEQSRNLRLWHAASPRRCHKTETWDCWREVQHRWQSVGPSNFSSVQLTRKSTAPRSALLVRQQFCEVAGKGSVSSNCLLCSRGRRLCCYVHAPGLPSPFVGSGTRLVRQQQRCSVKISLICTEPKDNVVEIRLNVDPGIHSILPKTSPTIYLHFSTNICW